MHFKNPCLILEALLAFRLTALRILSELIQVFILGISWNQTSFNWKASENLSPKPRFFQRSKCRRSGTGNWKFVVARTQTDARQTRCSSFGWSFSVALIARQGASRTRKKVILVRCCHEPQDRRSRFYAGTRRAVQDYFVFTCILLLYSMYSNDPVLRCPALLPFLPPHMDFVCFRLVQQYWIKLVWQVIGSVVLMWMAKYEAYPSESNLFFCMFLLKHFSNISGILLNEQLLYVLTCHSKVGNDVETEQLLCDESTRHLACGHVMSFVQVLAWRFCTCRTKCRGYESALQIRGSVPLFWSQEAAAYNPKPPVRSSNDLKGPATWKQFQIVCWYTTSAHSSFENHWESNNLL